VVRHGLLVWPWAHFQNGRLVVADTSWAEVVRPWTSPGAWRWEHGRGWRRAIPSWFHLTRMQAEIDRVRALPFPSVTNHDRAAAYAGAIAAIPSNVRESISPYPRHHVRLLWAARRGGEHFVQLMESHPLLALLLALRRRFGIAEDVRKLVDCKRRDLLGLFGFPARPWYARLLVRVPKELLTTRVLGYFRRPDALVWTALQELPLITRPTLELLDPHIRPWITIRLLHDIAASDKFSLRDARHLKSLIAVLQGEQPVPLHSLASLEGFFEFTRRCAARGLFLDSDRLLAPHPRPRCAAPGFRLTEIATEGALVKESLLLRHCAIEFREQAVCGSHYFYAVHWRNKRATLCLKQTTQGLVVADLVGLCNTSVDDDVWNFVEEWLGTPIVENRESSFR